MQQITPRRRSASAAQVEYIRPYGSTSVLPIFETLFLGGEYSVRGFDIRSIGPRGPRTGLVLGGNKSRVQPSRISSIAGPAPAVLRRRPGARPQSPVPPCGLVRASPTPGQVAAIHAGAESLRQLSRASAFKTSTGAEIRFFMPVLNVPFRLIFAMNPAAGGVLAPTTCSRRRRSSSASPVGSTVLAT